MPHLNQQLNTDFLASFCALDQTLSKRYGGIDGYLYEASTRVSYNPLHDQAVKSDLAALKACRVSYQRLIKTKVLTEPLATEDDIDFLRDFLARFEDGRDPIARLKSRADSRNNSDAEKYLPIESEAREISRRRVMQKRTKALLATALALFSVGITLALRFRKGLTE